MHDRRRQFLIGLGSALVTGSSCYIGYRLGLRRRPSQPEPRESEQPRVPPVELARIQAELGGRLSSEAVHRPMAFDRRAEFGEIREVLRALGPVGVELVVEVHSRHRSPYLAGLPTRLDVGPEPGMLAQDAEVRAKQAELEPMPTPWTSTGIHVARNHVRIDRGGELQELAAPLQNTEGRWDDSMWSLAQRGGVSRLHSRPPWIFADDDTPWGLVVRVLEATAPPRCQPRFEARGQCTNAWANLFVGPPTA